MVGTLESKKHGTFSVFLEPMKGERFVSKKVEQDKNFIRSLHEGTTKEEATDSMGEECGEGFKD